MSGLLADVHEELNMPGGVGFVDATNVLERGTQDMAFGSIITVEGFELGDAMSALEIMDPRMDSGRTECLSPFDPNMPLLPSEVCWILDRSVACEMSWHSGLALSQTVHTLQYVHHIGDITHPFFVVNPTQPADPANGPADLERPLKLVTLVLRAAVFGLLKCCDFVWRELSHDHLVDGEDWNSEKFGVSLCEGIQSESLLSLLDEAVTWLQQSPSLVSSPWREPLIQRLMMRKNIFQSLSSYSFSTLQDAQNNLGAILGGPSPPEPSASVLSVFDPTITRRLVSLIPTRIVEIPPQPLVWEAVATWLDQWQQSRRLVDAETLMSVKVLASLRAYEDHSPRRSAFLRSLSISTFFNGSKILLTHDPPWLIDRFFLETAAIPQGILCQMDRQLLGCDSDSRPVPVNNQEVPQQDLNNGPSNPSPVDVSNDVELLEKGLAKLLVDYVTSFYHNRARRRRKLVASLLDWHLAFEHASTIVTQFSAKSSLGFYLQPTLSRVPLCVRHTRLLIITEVVLSGFELELYARHEWAMMYWYVGQVLSTQVAVLDELEASLIREDDDPSVFQALVYTAVQRDYAIALQCFASAMRDILCRYSPSTVQIDPSREQANFGKRFKWAFHTGYSEATILDDDRPILGKWRRWRIQHELDGHETDQVVQNLAHARDGFLRLFKRKPADTAATFCIEEYREFMLGLARACDANLLFFQEPPKVMDESVHVWKWEFSRWFPQLERS